MNDSTETLIQADKILDELIDRCNKFGPSSRFDEAFSKWLLFITENCNDADLYTLCIKAFKVHKLPVEITRLDQITATKFHLRMFPILRTLGVIPI
jgi:hypothetical protein